MASVAELAEARQNRLISINQTTTNRVSRLWQGVDFDNLDTSWMTVGPQMAAQVTAGQLTAAKGSDSFTSKVSSVYGFEEEASALVAGAIAGVDGKGRPVDGALYGAVTTTKRATGSGLGRAEAFHAGAAYLASMVKTMMADSGRAADMVAATGKGYTRYVRVVNPGACSRCAILSGVSDYKTAFKRHPACKCSSAPVMDDGSTKTPPGTFDSADEYFESLSEAEQDRVFTKAGAQAIRDGADVQSVVSARRGATGITTSRGVGRETRPNSGRRLQKTTVGHKPDGSPIEVYTTSEGTTRRGAFAKQQKRLNVADTRLAGSRYSSTTRVRLMPEEIYNVAKSPAEARVLLRDAGYLDTPGLSPAQRIEQALTDRKLADRLYGRAGYQLG